MRCLSCGFLDMVAREGEECWRCKERLACSEEEFVCADCSEENDDTYPVNAPYLHSEDCGFFREQFNEWRNQFCKNCRVDKDDPDDGNHFPWNCPNKEMLDKRTILW